MEVEFITVLGAVILALAGKEGFTFIRMRFNGKKHNNPSGERRHSLLTSADREFFRECFKDQEKVVEDCFRQFTNELELWMIQHIKD